MSIVSNVTEQDLINLRKLAKQQKNQRALKIKIITLKQTHDIKLAESLNPFTEKLEEVNQLTRKVGEVLKESNSENENNQEIVSVEIESEDENIQINPKAFPISNKFSTSMMKTLGVLINSKNTLKLVQEKLGRAAVLGVSVITLGDRIRRNDNS